MKSTFFQFWPSKYHSEGQTPTDWTPCGASPTLWTSSPKFPGTTKSNQCIRPLQTKTFWFLQYYFECFFINKVHIYYPKYNHQFLYNKLNDVKHKVLVNQPIRKLIRHLLIIIISLIVNTHRLSVQSMGDVILTW